MVKDRTQDQMQHCSEIIDISNSGRMIKTNACYVEYNVAIKNYVLENTSRQKNTHNILATLDSTM